MSTAALISAVLTGALFLYFFREVSQKYVPFLLAFSGAYLLSTTVFVLLPEVYTASRSDIGIYIMAGILLQIVLEYFSKGAEHGHMQSDKNDGFPWLLFVSLCIHAFIEGMPLGNHNHTHSLLWAIVIHKVPVSILLCTFLVRLKLTVFQMSAFILLFALMTPMGNFFGMYLPVFRDFHTEISALVIGVFLHISTTILFESSRTHAFNFIRLVIIILGVALAYVGLLF